MGTRRISKKMRDNQEKIAFHPSFVVIGLFISERKTFISEKNDSI